MRTMLKIEKPAIKSNNGFDAHITRSPVLEESKLRYYIYFAESETIPRENSLEKFKKRCEELSTQFNEEKLINFLEKEKKHIIINPYLNNDTVIKMINKYWEEINEDDCYFIGTSDFQFFLG